MQLRGSSFLFFFFLFLSVIADLETHFSLSTWLSRALRKICSPRKYVCLSPWMCLCVRVPVHMYVNATSIPCFEHKHEHVVGFPICSHGNSRKFLCGARPGRSLVELKNNYTYTPTYTFLVFPNDSEIALMTHLMAEFRKRTCLD